MSVKLTEHRRFARRAHSEDRIFLGQSVWGFDELTKQSWKKKEDKNQKNNEISKPPEGGEDPRPRNAGAEWEVCIALWKSGLERNRRRTPASSDKCSCAVTCFKVINTASWRHKTEVVTPHLSHDGATCWLLARAGYFSTCSRTLSPS